MNHRAAWTLCVFLTLVTSAQAADSTNPVETTGISPGDRTTVTSWRDEVAYAEKGYAVARARQAPRTADYESLTEFLSHEDQNALHMRGGDPLHLQRPITDQEVRRILDLAARHGERLSFADVRAASPYFRLGDTPDDKRRITVDVAPLVALAVMGAYGCLKSMAMDLALHFAAVETGVGRSIFEMDNMLTDVLISCGTGALTGGIAGVGLAKKAWAAGKASVEGLKFSDELWTKAARSWRITRREVATSLGTSVVKEAVLRPQEASATGGCTVGGQAYGITGSTVAQYDDWATNCVAPAVYDLNASEFAMLDASGEVTDGDAVVPTAITISNGTHFRPMIPGSGGVATVTSTLLVPVNGTVWFTLYARNEGIDYVVTNQTIPVTDANRIAPIDVIAMLTSESLLALNPGSDNRFLLWCSVAHSNGFTTSYYGKSGSGFSLFIDTTEIDTAPVVTTGASVGAGVVTFVGSYLDSENPTPALLELAITGPSGTQTIDLLPSLIGSGDEKFFSREVNLPNGIHTWQLIYKDRAAATVRQTTPSSLRISSTPPVVQIQLSNSQPALGEIITGTVSVADAAGPISGIEVGLSCDGHGPFYNAAGEKVRKVVTGGNGLATFRYEVTTSGEQAILAMEPSHEFALAWFQVEGSSSDLYARFTVNWISGDATTATYNVDVYVEYPIGNPVAISEDLCISANHGHISSPCENAGEDHSWTGYYDLTAAEAAEGPEALTLTLPNRGVSTTYFVELRVGAPAPLTPFRTLGLIADATDSDAYPIDMSADGTRIAYINGATVSVLDFETLASVAAVSNRYNGNAVAFSPDGSRLAYADGYGNLSIIDIASQTIQKRTLLTPSGASTDLILVRWFSDTGIAVASIQDVGYTPRVFLVTVDGTGTLTNIQPYFVSGVTEYDAIETLECSGAAALCVASASTGAWDLFTTYGSLVYAGMNIKTDPVHAIAFSAAGDKLLIGGDRDSSLDTAYLRLMTVSHAGVSDIGRPQTANDYMTTAGFVMAGGVERLVLSGTAATEVFDPPYVDLPTLSGAAQPNYTNPLRVCGTGNAEAVIMSDNYQQVYNLSGDDAGPTVELDPIEDLVYRDTATTVSGTLADPSGVRTATSSRDGVTWTDIPLDAFGSFIVNIADLPIGATPLHIRASDRYLNQTALTVTITRPDDPEPPVISAVRVEPNEVTIGGIARVSTTVSDLHSAVASVTATFRIGTTIARVLDLSLVSGESWAADVATAAMPPGTYSVDITATDTAHANTASKNAAASFRLLRPFVAPANLIATATGGGTVAVTWGSVDGAAFYRLFRSMNNSGFTLYSTPQQPLFTDAGCSVATTCAYKVLAVSASGVQSPLSNVDVATTVTFTDDPVTAKLTRVRAAHVIELRTAANAVRAAAGLAPFAFTDPVLVGKSVRAVHFQELQSVIADARARLGAATTFSASINPNFVVRAQEINELRAAVR